ncbi:tyrosine-protein phosphatase [Aurantiacibacter luteus]|uniref:tyrosine-protein phosphatase n=1 Tax=Aurantiacibacter luteus TaxID=1581420 RepID=UPI000699DE94|nr:tyrosine-protein phosphatase [Aurantiacibacter luteus]
MSLTAADRERLLGLAGAPNFRDFGGYAVEGGGRVKRGLLFRSNRMSLLSPEETARLERIGIATIFDLRTPPERAAHPCAWEAPHLATHTWPSGHKRRLVDMARDYPRTVEGARQVMLDFYAELPRVLGHAFGDIVVKIANGTVPCVINCSAGKDRTGMAAALVLTALGVSRADVLDDYAMTGRVMASAEGMAEAVFIGTGGGEKGQTVLREGFAPDAVAMLRSSRAEFLESAFAGIDADYGSLPAYFAAIGVDEGVRARLAALLVEPD